MGTASASGGCWTYSIIIRSAPGPRCQRLTATDESQDKLIFHCYGNPSFLSEIWLGGYEGRQLKQNGSRACLGYEGLGRRQDRGRDAHALKQKRFINDPISSSPRIPKGAIDTRRTG